MEAEELKKSIETKKQEVDFIERNKTWNWENMCHVTEERTIINKNADSEVGVWMVSELRRVGVHGYVCGLSVVCLVIYTSIAGDMCAQPCTLAQVPEASMHGLRV